jgi:hypothetical protein
MMGRSAFANRSMAAQTAWLFGAGDVSTRIVRGIGAELPQRAGVAFGSMTGGDFVTRIDYRDTVSATGLKDRLEMGTMYPEEMPDADRLQRADQKLAACNRGHSTPLSP